MKAAGLWMTNCKTWMLRHSSFVVYTALMLGCGIWQLIDWYCGSEDPIWHILFYIFFMPAFSLAYGFLSENSWLAPLIAVFLTASVYIFMANGGFSISTFKSALELCVPSLLASIVGVMLHKIVKLFD